MKSWLSNADLWLESKAEPDLWLHNALLQAWLWFGVLHVFFERFKIVDTDLFLLRTGPGAERLDTSGLRTLLVEWQSWTHEVDSDELKTHFDSVHSILGRAAEFNKFHNIRFGNRSTSVENIAFSVHILIETLYNAITMVTDGTEFPLPLHVTNTLISEGLGENKLEVIQAMLVAIRPSQNRDVDQIEDVIYAHSVASCNIIFKDPLAREIFETSRLEKEVQLGRRTKPDQIWCFD